MLDELASDRSRSAESWHAAAHGESGVTWRAVAVDVTTSSSVKSGRSRNILDSAMILSVGELYTDTAESGISRGRNKTSVPATWNHTADKYHQRS